MQLGLANSLAHKPTAISIFSALKNYKFPARYSNNTGLPMVTKTTLRYGSYSKTTKRGRL